MRARRPRKADHPDLEDLDITNPKYQLPEYLDPDCLKLDCLKLDYPMLDYPTLDYPTLGFPGRSWHMGWRWCWIGGSPNRGRGGGC